MRLLLVDRLHAATLQPLVDTKQADVGIVYFNSLKDSLEAVVEAVAAASNDGPVTDIALVQHHDLSPRYSLVAAQEPETFLAEEADASGAYPSWAPVRDFVSALAQRVGLQRLDFLACALYRHTNTAGAFAWMEAETGVDLRASSNMTGAAAKDGDWILESDNVDIRSTYFTSEIDSFEGLLLSPSFDKVNDRHTEGGRVFVASAAFFAVLDPDGKIFTWGGSTLVAPYTPSNLTSFVAVALAATGNDVFAAMDAGGNVRIFAPQGAGSLPSGITPSGAVAVSLIRGGETNSFAALGSGSPTGGVYIITVQYSSGTCTWAQATVGGVQLSGCTSLTVNGNYLARKDDNTAFYMTTAPTFTQFSVSGVPQVITQIVGSLAISSSTTNRLNWAPGGTTIYRSNFTLDVYNVTFAGSSVVWFVGYDNGLYSWSAGGTPARQQSTKTVKDYAVLQTGTDAWLLPAEATDQAYRAVSGATISPSLSNSANNLTITDTVVMSYKWGSRSFRWPIAGGTPTEIRPGGGDLFAGTPTSNGSSIAVQDTAGGLWAIGTAATGGVLNATDPTRPTNLPSSVTMLGYTGTAFVVYDSTNGNLWSWGGAGSFLPGTPATASTHANLSSVKWRYSPVPQTPASTSFSSSTVAEGDSFSATLSSPRATSYSITGGADAGSFQIGGSTLSSKAGVVFDFDTKQSYAVTVTASNSGGSGTATGLTITVTNATPSAPTFVSGATTVANGATWAGATFSASDPGGGAITYVLGGADVGSFSLNSSGVLTSNPSGVVYLFATKSSYTVTVAVRDAQSNTSATTAFTLTVLAPPAGTSAAYAYQWLVCDTPTGTYASLGAGATGTSLLLTQAHVAKYLMARMSYTDNYGQSELVLSSAVGPIANVNDVATGAPVIAGTVTQGQVLTASTASVADADGLGAFAYTWSSSATIGGTYVAISGATASTFTPTQAQVGKYLKVRVGFTDALGAAEALDSAVVGPVANVNDGVTGTLSISGTASQGQVLSANASLADADGLGTFAYTWSVGDVSLGPFASISGATAATFTLTQAQVGKYVRVRVAYTDGFGTAEVVDSAATGPIANVNDVATGTPVIVGSVTQGQALSADGSSIADVDGLGAFAYTWSSCDTAGGTFVAISGATASTLTPTQAEVGKYLKVRVSFTDVLGGAEVRDSAVVGPVANVNDAPTGVPFIVGTATQGQVLTANTASIVDADGLGTLSYAWRVCDTAGGTYANLSGATANTFTLTQAQVGKYLRLRVSYTDGFGFAEVVDSAAAGPVGNVNDSPTGTPLIVGTTTQGLTLTADTASIADADGLGAFSYAWRVSDSSGGTYTTISGATANTLLLTQGQVGKFLRLRVSYTDAYGAAEAVESAGVGPVLNINDVATGAPLIVGTLTQGQVLSADGSSVADLDGLGPFSYTWSVSSAAGGTFTTISGATASTFTLTQAEVSKYLKVRISFTDALGSAEALISAPVGPVANVNDVATGAPVIVGTPTQGQTLSVSTTSLADVDGLGAFAYAWLSGSTSGGTFTAISGATAATFTPTQAQVGTYLKVRVSYTDGWGSAEVVNSVVTGPVANVNDVATGAPVIVGSVVQGQALSADASSIADVDGLGAFAYTWSASSSSGGSYVAISGATANTFTPTQAEVGKYLRVRVAFTDALGGAESRDSAVVGPVANVNDAPAGAPLVVGTVMQGQTLGLNVASVADADGLGTFSYAWRVSDSSAGTYAAISGATAATFTPSQAEVGKYLRVRISYTDGFGSLEVVDSAVSGPVVNVNDLPEGSVAIVGSHAVGQMVVADVDALSDADGLGTLKYAWQTGPSATGPFTDVAGATTNYLLLTRAAVAWKYLRLRVYYTDGGGAAEQTFSASPQVVTDVPGTPTNVAVAVRSTAGTVSWTEPTTPGITSYEVLNGAGNVVATVDAPATSLAVTGLTNGTAYAFRVRAYDGIRYSTASTAVAATPFNTPSTGSIAFAGFSSVPTQLQTLTATATIADVDGLGPVSYQWYAGTEAGRGSAIAGATGLTLTLTQAHVGAYLRLQADFVDLAGTPEFVLSAAVGPVANVNDAPSGSPLIVGSAVQGQMLSVDASAVVDADGLGAFSYAWLCATSGGGAYTAILHATGSTYTPGQAEVGRYVKARVTYTDRFGAAEVVDSAALGPVANVNDAPQGALVVSGAPTQGQRLSMSTAGLTDADGLPSAFEYHWLASNAPTGTFVSLGADASGLLLTQAHVGRYVVAKVAYTDALGCSEMVLSAPLGPIANVNDAPAGSVDIIGTFAVGQLLVAAIGALSDEDGLGNALHFQWQSGATATGAFTDVSGATNSFLLLTQALAVRYVRARVFYTDGYGTDEQIFSQDPRLVIAPPGAPTGVSAVAGPGRATVTWTAPSTVGGSPVLSYTVTASSEAGATYVQRATSSGFLFLGLPYDGVRVTFRVAAVNAAGTGATSEASPAVTPYAAPVVPTVIVSTADSPGTAGGVFVKLALAPMSTLTTVTATVVGDGDGPAVVVASIAYPVAVVGDTRVLKLDLAAGTTYSIAVRAANGVYYADSTVPLVHRVGVPPTPTVVPVAPVGLVVMVKSEVVEGAVASKRGDAVASTPASTLEGVALAVEGASTSITLVGATETRSASVTETVLTPSTEGAISATEVTGFFERMTGASVPASVVLSAGPAFLRALSLVECDASGDVIASTATSALRQFTVAVTADMLALDVYGTPSQGFEDPATTTSSNLYKLTLRRTDTVEAPTVAYVGANAAYGYFDATTGVFVIRCRFSQVLLAGYNYVEMGGFDFSASGFDLQWSATSDFNFKAC